LLAYRGCSTMRPLRGVSGTGQVISTNRYPFLTTNVIISVKITISQESFFKDYIFIVKRS